MGRKYGLGKGMARCGLCKNPQFKGPAARRTKKLKGKLLKSEEKIRRRRERRERKLKLLKDSKKKLIIAQEKIEDSIKKIKMIMLKEKIVNLRRTASIVPRDLAKQYMFISRSYLNKNDGGLKTPLPHRRANEYDFIKKNYVVSMQLKKCKIN